MTTTNAERVAKYQREQKKKWPYEFRARVKTEEDKAKLQKLADKLRAKHET